jgi:Rrf2 family nitric oxide-sensitive transcriptional repressor
MQLTRYSDYSLRVLIHLAVTGRPLTTIEEIARAYGISHAHLTKVVQHLSALGLVETVRGRRGGLRLARAPDQVDVGQFQPDGECPIKPACVLRQALDEALEAFLAVLDRYTLADLVSRRRAVLARLLTIEGA